MNSRLRAPMVYFGGKGVMATKLLPLIPEGGRPYCEPFMGAASIFFARTPACTEVLNDIDTHIVTLFRVLQDERLHKRLEERLYYTLYARSELARAIQTLQEHAYRDAVDHAWAVMVVHNFRMGGKKLGLCSWGRVFTSSGGMAGTVRRWLMRCALVGRWHERLRGVQIDNRDALDVIRYWDNPDAVFYVDPPYVHGTRKSKNNYLHECDDDYHRKLVNVLLACTGAVVVSGYENAIYAALEEAGWQKTTFKVTCNGAVRGRGSKIVGIGAAFKKVPRVEAVWRNRRAAALCAGPQILTCNVNTGGAE